MEKTMKARYLVASVLAMLGLLMTNPANALQTAASLNMDRLTITLTDLDATDAITPQFIFSNQKSSAAWSWTKQPNVGEYFTQLVDYKTTSLTGWTTALNESYVTPGNTTSDANLTAGSLGTTQVIGWDDGYALWAQCGFSADFTLTGNTQLDIFIPSVLMVDPTGSNPTPKQGAEAYARTYLQLSSLSSEGIYEGLAYDTLWRDHWTSGNLNGDLHVTFQNTLASSYEGFMDVGAFSVNMSYGSSASVPEPTTMLLLGFGLVGLVGVKRKFKG